MVKLEADDTVELLQIENHADPANASDYIGKRLSLHLEGDNKAHAGKDINQLSTLPVEYGLPHLTTVINRQRIAGLENELVSCVGSYVFQATDSPGNQTHSLFTDFFATLSSRFMQKYYSSLGQITSRQVLFDRFNELIEENPLIFEPDGQILEGVQLFNNWQDQSKAAETLERKPKRVRGDFEPAYEQFIYARGMNKAIEIGLLPGKSSPLTIPSQLIERYGELYPLELSDLSNPLQLGRISLRGRIENAFKEKQDSLSISETWTKGDRPGVAAHFVGVYGLADGATNAGKIDESEREPPKNPTGKEDSQTLCDVLEEFKPQTLAQLKEVLWLGHQDILAKRSHGRQRRVTTVAAAMVSFDVESHGKVINAQLCGVAIGDSPIRISEPNSRSFQPISTYHNLMDNFKATSILLHAVGSERLTSIDAPPGAVIEPITIKPNTLIEVSSDGTLLEAQMKMKILNRVQKGELTLQEATEIIAVKSQMEYTASSVLSGHGSYCDDASAIYVYLPEYIDLKSILFSN